MAFLTYKAVEWLLQENGISDIATTCQECLGLNCLWNFAVACQSGFFSPDFAALGLLFTYFSYMQISPIDCDGAPLKNYATLTIQYIKKMALKGNYYSCVMLL